MTGLLADLHFLRPDWLWALVALPLIAWFWRRRGDDRVWRQAIDAPLRPHVLETGRAGAGLRRLPWLLAWTLAVLALAGPAWQAGEQPVYRSQTPLLIALDLSSRQTATDLPPDRATRARFKISRLLQRRLGGQVGLLVYADDAFTVAPLTDDAATVSALVDALSPALMPADGQRGDRAIERAAALLTQAGFGAGQILVLTDQADDRAQEAATRARERGLSVSVLGLGTAQGAPLPGPDASFERNPDGTVRFARLDEASLRALARAGDGRYARFSTDDDDLEALAVLDPQSAVAVEGDRVQAVWRDDGPWLLLLVLPLLLLGFRRGGLAVVLLALWLPTPPALAFELADLWSRPDRRADAALRAGDAETARRLARDPALAGAAAYRAGDYQAAIEAWSKRDDAVSHYNRGNALAQAGAFDQAIAAYRQALERDPGMEDAKANEQALRDWLARQPPAPDAGGQGNADDPAGDDGEKGQGQPGVGQPQQDGDADVQDQSGRDPDADAGQDSSQEDGRSADQASTKQAGGGSRDQDGAGSGDQPVSAADQAAAGQALREAMEQALREQALREQAQGGTGQQPDPAQPDQPEAGQSSDAPAALDPEQLAEEERQRAVERWLRQVPDDPGGLLRRKFAIEHQRRQQTGANDR